jgi:hypothetical protein
MIFRWVLKAGFRKNKKLVSCDKMTNSSVTTEVEKGRKKERSLSLMCEVLNCYIQSALRITPTAIPSILNGCVAKSTLIG